ncbi:G-PROTEIN-RECEP-F1-2 domain-containing protein [Aphelenchoides fujianensis]|nr:G-PROTEIN-RECEP-F1-2 domain-containing protein [Aphelenchoides fujianensis]
MASNSTAGLPADYVNNLSVPEYMYLTYRHAGPQPLMYCAALFDFLVMLVGYFGNTLVIAAVFKNKTLRGSCNYFLCLACLGDLLHQSAHFVFLYVTLSGVNFIPYRTCLYWNTIPQAGIAFSYLGTFFVGIDRLIGVGFPTYYRNIKPLYYVSAFYLLAVLIASYFLFLSYSFKGESVMVVCIIIDSLGGDAQQLFFQLCVLVNVADIVIYSIVWAMLRTKTGRGNENMKKVFRSLQVIMFSVAAGWLITALVVGLIIPFAHVPISQQWFWGAYFGWLPNIASASNFFTLYFFSQEYRLTFQSLLAPVFPCFRQGGKTRLFEGSRVGLTNSTAQSAAQSAHF